MVEEVSTGMSSECGLVDYHVFRQLSIDDEPSTLGTYTASDAAGELPYSREVVLSSLVSMVWSTTCIGRRNGNGCGG